MNKMLLVHLFGALAFSVPATASEAAEQLVESFGIETYSASREDDDLYELSEGYIVRTRYCYAYVYYEDVVIVDDKIIFIESDEVCDIEDIYRR